MVVARFKPCASRYRDGDDADVHDDCDAAAVTLPLHQRVQLIKLANGCSTAEALRELKRQGLWFGGAVAGPHEQGKPAPAPAAAEDGPPQVASQADVTAAAELVPHVHTVDPATGQVVVLAPGVGLRSFAFDGVMCDQASQHHMYETSTRRLVIDFLNGFNTTVIGYGQTGSGKTYTMFGPSDPARQLHSQRGIVPRACEDIFDALRVREGAGVHAELAVSYVEVYGDAVTDLLTGGVPVAHSKVAASRFVLAGERQLQVRTMADVEQALRAGGAQKRMAATAMNARSSRAHSLFILTLQQHPEDADTVVRSQLFLADLGGSEQVKKSKLEHGVMTEHVGHVKGSRMREAVNINLGLLALKQCIEALNRRADYVPYQDSKLTMLLSGGLGGDSKTTVIICGSMERSNAAETLQTLRFGEKCGRIQITAQANKFTLLSVMKGIDDQVAALEQQIAEKEHWEVSETVREDTLLEAGTLEAAQAKVTGGERVVTTRLAGAEQERQQLEQLLRKRAQLTGDNVDMSLAQHGFGGQYGGQVTAMGGHAEMRFMAKSKQGLKIKGKCVAEWQD